MKSVFLSPLLIALAASQQQCPNLIWNDEFEGSDLDFNKWTPQIGNGCDLGVDLCGWGNAELQFYRRENIRVQNGMLQIQALQEDFNANQYTSARIRSIGLGDIDLTKPVRVEARAKVPAGQGLWSAMWMLPTKPELRTWPKFGEIDFLEYIGREPDFAHGYFHYGDFYNDKAQKGGPLRMTTSPSENFHVYGFEKWPNRIDFFVDGFIYQSYSADDIEQKFNWPFEEVFHFIINLAVGGHWPGYPDETTVFPGTLEVDYVRAYDISNSTLPKITGNTTVRVNQMSEEYCLIDIVPGSTVTWALPEGAALSVPFSDLGSDRKCVNVDFGTASGYVIANVGSDCGEEQYSIPVHLAEFYEREQTFVGADGTLDQAALIEVIGTYTADSVQNAVMYRRDILDPYDYIQYSTSAISDASAYVSADKGFFMDIMSTTSAPCTRVIIQLEDSSQATPPNYPVGRHSRYVAYIDDTDDWQRLQFKFTDRPDANVTVVDRISVLIDSMMLRSDVYYIRNFDSATSGCTTNCEPLSTNQCRTRAKSEIGACNDGLNNDGFGYDGDGPMDCEDSDCWDDPVCNNVTLAAPPAIEICNDGIDNDNNGATDCMDEACSTSPDCGSWFQPSCSANPACAAEGPGDCCPNPVRGFLDCCTDNQPASCAHSGCMQANGEPLDGDCCPTSDGKFLECCDMSKCDANPKCSGLGEEDCCPSANGVFRDCCENRPDSCTMHPKCNALGLKGDCCGTPGGTSLACCEPPQCTEHPECAAFSQDIPGGNCCPSNEGVFMECCNLDLQFFGGSTIEYKSVESLLNTSAGDVSSASAVVFAPLFLVGLLFGLLLTLA